MTHPGDCIDGRHGPGKCVPLDEFKDRILGRARYEFAEENERLRSENTFLRLDRDVVAADDRDRWVRLFNRLEAAVSHHKKVTDQLFADTHDEALYAARDRVLRDSAERTT